jgi:hypothetical protein
MTYKEDVGSQGGRFSTIAKDNREKDAQRRSHEENEEGANVQAQIVVTQEGLARGRHSRWTVPVCAVLDTAICKRLAVFF